MHNELNSVRYFMEAMGQTVRHRPVLKLDRDEIMLRLHLLREEFAELRESLGVGEDEHGWFLYENRPPLNPAKLLDCLTDFCYVLLGTYHTLGLAAVADAGFEEVHMANMTKRGANGLIRKDSNGKVLRGPDYKAPDMQKILDLAFDPEKSNPFNPQ